MSYAADTPDIDFAVVVSARHDFWGHIQWAAKDLFKATHRVADGSKSEICQLKTHLVVRGVMDQHVLRLYISVNDVLLVHVVEWQKDLLNELSSLRLREHLVFDDMIVKFAAFDNLRDDVVVNLILKHLNDPDNVWVVGLRKNVKLLFHQVDEYLVRVYVFLWHNFHGELLPADAIQALTDLPERPLSESLTNLVFACDVCRLF